MIMKRYTLVLISLVTLIQINGQVITNYTTAEGLLDNFVECLDIDARTTSGLEPQWDCKCTMVKTG